ncbi:MAG TPA: nitrous oxide reductase family maturation protein NosD [bacterium]|nr:nitrous oxide reductase family maturation protein NosD [bacterium]
MSRASRLVCALIAALLVPAAVVFARGAGRAEDPSVPQGSIEAALAQAPVGGAVTVRGVHHERIVIRRSVIVRCEGATLDGGGRGTVITVVAPDVTIDGCVVRNSGDELVFEDSGIFVAAPRARIVRNAIEDVLFGVYLKGAPGSVIEDNTIRGRALELSMRGDSVKVFNSPESRVARNRIDGGRDFLIWYSDDVTIDQNVVVHGRYGLHFMNSHGDVLTRNRFVDDAIGSYVMYSDHIRLVENVFARSRTISGFGLAIKESNGTVALRNLFVDNSVGLYLDDSPYGDSGWGEFRGNVVAGNGVGIWLLSNVRHNRFGGNVFADNVEQVRVDGGILAGNEWAPEGRGNYWSDYAGFDANGDGVGDVPNRVEKNFEQLAETHPEARILRYSPAVNALDFAASALPIFAPRPVLQDPAPLMHAAIPPAFVRHDRLSPAFAGIAAALMVTGALTSFAGARRRRGWRR